MSISDANKRKHLRFRIELPLDYPNVEGKEIYGGIVADASEGGILAFLPEKIDIGTILNIEIYYVWGFELDTIKATAKVAWSDMVPSTGESEVEYRHGLEFQSIEEKDFIRLQTLFKEAVK